MKVENMRNSSGNRVKNQFIIYDGRTRYFQSYNATIVKRFFKNGKVNIILDRKYWNYSKTTSKYRNLFLLETKKETEAKIKSGEYELGDLN